MTTATDQQRAMRYNGYHRRASLEYGIVAERGTLTLSAAERPGVIEQRVRALQSSVPVA